MLANLTWKSLDDAFLGKYSVFLIFDALRDALFMTTDFKFKMILALGLLLSQTVQVFYLQKFWLYHIELQVQLFWLLSSHCKSSIQLVQSFLELIDSILRGLENIYFNMDLIYVLEAEQSSFKSFHFSFLNLFKNTQTGKLCCRIADFLRFQIVKLNGSLVLWASQS